MKLIDKKNRSSIPWEGKPEGCCDYIWRYPANPIITSNDVPGANSIFNSAVVEFEDGFAGVFRCDDKARRMRIHSGFSKNGVNWKINHRKIEFTGEVAQEILKFDYAYDPRVCWIDDRYYITWCNGYHDMPTIAVGYTYDFKTFHQMENAFLPFNRNGVLFPRKINGKYVMLSRPSDSGHTPFGDIFISQSPNMTHWGEHRLVMRATDGWQGTKIGAGPIPIETDEGWLMIYHGVLNSCNGFVYSFGAALLDIDEPWKVIQRPDNYLLSPSKLYERVGDVPNVAFPCAALTDAASGRIVIYYGAADTSTCLAFTTIEEIANYLII
jgi:beta-1,4-mannooligosaccharide/beta-1,4-mannosyl-N-acetylglucosamine phosphorylase